MPHYLKPRKRHFSHGPLGDAFKDVRRKKESKGAQAINDGLMRGKIVRSTETTKEETKS